MTNTAQVGVRFSVSDADVVKRALAQMGDEGQKTLQKLERATQGPSKGLVAIDAAAKDVRGSFEAFAGRLGPLGSALSALGPAGLAAASGFGAVAAVITKSISEAAGAEDSMASLRAMTKLAGETAGLTAEDIDDLAQSLAQVGRASEDEFKAAAVQLLQFRSIGGSSIREILELSADLAATGQGNVSSFAETLARAMDGSEAGITALRRAIPSLTDVQIENLKTLQEQNRLYELQAEVLSLVRGKVEGLAKAQSETMSGGWDQMLKSYGEFFEELGKASGVTSTGGLFARIASGNRYWTETLFGKREGNYDHLRNLQMDASAAIAAGSAMVDRARADGLKSLERYQEIQRDKEARSAADLEKLQDQYNRERIANDQAVYELKQRQFEAFLKDMREAAKDALELNKDLAASAADIAMSPQAQAWFDKAQEAADRMKAINEESFRDIFDLWRDGWEDVLTGQLDSFESFFDKVSSIASRRFANKMAVQTEQYLTDLLGESGLDGLAAGLTGYQFGSRLGKARSGPGNEIGGTIGGVAGYAFGGPLGAFAGSAIGSFIGGQFGPRPSDRLEAVTRLFNPDGTMTRTEQDLGPNKDSPENRAAVNAFDDAVMDFVGRLKSVNLNPQTWAYTLSAGGGNSLAPFLASVNNSGEQGFQTADAAFKWVADQLVSTLSEVPAQLQSLVDNFDPSNIEDFLRGLNDFQAFQGTMGGINDELMRRRDPKAYDIMMLDRQFDPLKSSLMATADDLKAINDLYALMLKDINANYTTAVNDNGAWTKSMQDLRDEVAQATDPMKFQLDGLSKWRTDMRAAAKDNQEDLLLIEKVYGIRRAEILEDSLKTSQAKVADILAESARKQADILQGQISTQRDLAAFMKSTGKSYRDALFNMSIDSKSALPMDRLAILRSEFENLRPNALLGNRDAMDRLLDIGQQYEDVAQEVFGSNSDFIDIQKRVRDTFTDVAALAERQTTVAEDTLSVLELSYAELQKIAGGAGALVQGKPSGPQFTTTSQDFAAVNAAWVAAGRPAPGTAANAAFENVVRGLIDNAGADQSAYLTDMLKFQSGLLNDPVQGGIASRYSNDIIKQLGEIVQSGTATTAQTSAIVSALNSVAASNTVLSNDIRDVLARVA